LVPDFDHKALRETRRAIFIDSMALVVVGKISTKGKDGTMGKVDHAEYGKYQGIPQRKDGIDATNRYAV